MVSLYDFHYQQNLAGWTDGLFIHQSAIRWANSRKWAWVISR
jgi:hypothetical protein